MPIKFANSPMCVYCDSTVCKCQFTFQCVEMRKNEAKHSDKNSQSCMQHDNTPSYKVLPVSEFLREKQITMLEHPSYSQDLALCIFVSLFKDTRKLERNTC